MRPVRGDTPYTVSEVYALTAISSGVGVPTFGSITFTANALPNYSSWAAVFDRYRIKSAKVDFTPQSVQEITTAGQSVGIFHTLLDFDDNTAPTSVAAMQRYSTYCGIISTKPIRRALLPRAAAATYVSAVTTGYVEVEPNAWRDVAYGDIPHYSVKWGLDNTSAAALVIYNVLVTLTVEFAGRRG